MQIEDKKNSFVNEVLYLTNADPGTRYAVYLCYPMISNEEYTFQSAPMQSASMIKVFVLGTAMEQVRDEKLSLTQLLTLHDYDKVGGSGILAGYASGTTFSLDQILRLIITVSDNTATNMAIDLLGMDTINAYIQREGYTDTVLQRKMMDYQAMNAGWENYTSVRDLGHFFKKLYNRNCVSPELDDIMLGYLIRQTDDECFPAVYPNMMIAHKTGELAGVYADGGIFYDEVETFILVCMTEYYSSRGTAVWTLQQIARNAKIDIE